MYVSTSKLRAYLDCPKQFHYRYVLRLEPPEPPAVPLAVGSLLHRALARYQQERPTSPAAVIACVDAAVDAARGEFAPDVVAAARGEVAACALAYHERAAPSTPADGSTEVDLRLCIGPFTIVSVADLVIENGETVLHREFKRSRPHPAALTLQTVLAHAALRSKYPDKAIVHEVCVFRPKFELRRFELDEATYRATLDEVRQTVAAMSRDRAFEPRPGDACRTCSYAQLCPAAERLLVELAW